MKLKELTALNVFQKINLLLCSYIIIAIISTLIGLLIDLYNIYILSQPNNLHFVNFYDLLTISIGLFIISILPFAFTIFVHEMRKQMNPPIPKIYTKIKNAVYLIIIIGIVLPFIVSPIIKNNSTNHLIDLTNLIINKRHPRIENNYWGTLIDILILTFFVFPVIGLINWFHAMAFIVFDKIYKRFY